ncbi:folate-binding protein YgfZ [Candidatus Ruthia endofausta]|uniref:Folate-binding protein YgfZ n=1 Tax=Candidatus Ruthia endofausta TaxID=2738852 RepID=A0A6N0HNB6_9GAMM|nr:folate-binding protein YgfZ [Candidatus Ruthia endofausta]QKQ23823.1 folate-binding protein YgfZ [Candidatus Ruthia endofausta]
MKDRVTLKINGADAQSFLQGQLSNNIASIGENEWQLNAYCQHQGKVIALFWVTKVKGNFYLNFPDNLQNKVLKRLNMFILMANVEIKQATLNTNPPIDVMKHPEVYLITSEKFVPQELNLDIDEVGVSFSKGCYPGQEVVARLHYLGKPKRFMRLFECGQVLNVGDKLIALGSKSTKASGIVVRCVKSADKLRYLATIEVKYQDSEITCNDAKLTRIKND